MGDGSVTKILIIEDVESLRNDIIEMLQFEGFNVKGAENGLIGVSVAKSYLPDLIICDIMMPELDGYGVLEALRRDVETTVIPFIFLTALNDRADMRHGMGLGADDFLTKPFIASELLDAINARLVKQKVLNKVVDNKMTQLRNNIITALPHELRTPLNSIIGFSDMLIFEADRLDSTQVVEMATQINTSAQRLYRLVENYLLYVRAEILVRSEAERHTYLQSELDYPNMVVQFQATMCCTKHGRSEDITFFLCDETMIHITENDLTKITEELVDNALKFSEKGQPVTIRTEVDDHHFIMQVEDKGRGLTGEQISSIGAYVQFDRWFYEQQGSGLGLAIVCRLLDVYDGDVKVESIPNEWTRVTIRIRRAKG
jgi:two-component system sensor histidine kinase/response regulator